MRREQAVLLRLVLVAVGETLQEGAERLAVVAGLLRQVDTHLVGIEFVATIVGVLEHVAIDRVPDTAEERRPAGRGAGAQLHRTVFPERVDGVLARDVANLVTKHTGQLRLVLDEAESAARDVDEAAG